MSASRNPQSIDSSRAPEPVGAYPHAKRVGDFVFLSGIGPRERGTARIPADGIVGTISESAGFAITPPA